MRYVFTFPDIGEGITEGTIVTWYIEKGQQVKTGDPVVQMETDKVVTDIPSPKNGVVVTRFGREGDTIGVGDSLIELDIPEVVGEAAVKVKAEADARAAGGDTKENIDEGGSVVGSLEVAGSSAYLPASTEGAPAMEPEEKRPGIRQKALATPVARAAAKHAGVNIDAVKGTGPAGRVTKGDVENFVKNRGTRDFQGTAAADRELKIEIEPISQLRKTIAYKMTESLRETASVSVFDEAEISGMREAFRRYEKSGEKIRLLPVVVKAVTTALKQHPLLNAELDLEKGSIIRKMYYNMGIAVDTPDGLVVPVVRDTDKKSVVQLTEEIRVLAEKARTRSLRLEEMQDGTFSISNFGAIGGRFATPIINYPQSAILGLGRLSARPVVKSGEVVPGEVLPLSLTVDHRLIDGGEASRFLLDCIRYLTDPVQMVFDV